MDTTRTNRRTRVRVKSKFRFITFLVIMFGLMVGAFGFAAGTYESTASVTTDYATYAVEAGDTLWDIACEYGPSNMDPRIVVQEICDANDITPEDIHCGDSVFVPIEINR